MNAGEFFVSLGVKGADKSVGAIGEVKKGMGEMKSMSLEAKAAILGSVLALQNLFSKSGQAGTNLTNFNAATGLSTKTLQEWQYAMRQAGGSAEDITGAVTSIQSAMAKVDLGKGVPEGLQLLSENIEGGLDFSKKDDPFYMLESIQKAAQKMSGDPKLKAIFGELASSMGLNKTVQAGMMRNTFTDKNFKNAPKYSDSEIGSLDKANVAWGNLGQKVEMAIGKFNAKHGGQLVTDISKIVDQVVKLAEAFVTLSEKMKLFEGIGKMFEGWTSIFTGLNSTMDEFKKGEGLKGLGNTAKDVGGWIGSMVKDAVVPDLQPAGVGYRAPSSVAPKMPAPAQKSNGPITVNQNLNFQHDGKDAKKVARDTKQAIGSGMRSARVN